MEEGKKRSKKRNTQGILRGCNIGHRRGGAKKKPRAFDDQVVLCSFDYQVARKLWSITDIAAPPPPPSILKEGQIKCTFNVHTKPRFYARHRIGHMAQKLSLEMSRGWIPRGIWKKDLFINWTICFPNVLNIPILHEVIYFMFLTFPRWNRSGKLFWNLRIWNPAKCGKLLSLPAYFQGGRKSNIDFANFQVLKFCHKNVPE